MSKDAEAIKAKRDTATYRAYRRGNSRYEVKAIAAGERYRVIGNEFKHEYFARTCDDAMSQHVARWKI